MADKARNEHHFPPFSPLVIVAGSLGGGFSQSVSYARIFSVVCKAYAFRCYHLIGVYEANMRNKFKHKSDLDRQPREGNSPRPRSAVINNLMACYTHS